MLHEHFSVCLPNGVQDGGEFVRLESLDLQKYAQRPAIAKALCDYMCLVQVAKNDETAVNQTGFIEQTLSS